MFGDVKAFSAEAESVVKTGGETVTIPMDFALLDGKMRMELDMTKMKSKQLPAEMLSMLKEIGLDRMVNIVLPERKLMWIIYPSVKAFAEMPTPEDAAGVTDKNVRIDTTQVGRESIAGHPCIKTKVVLTDSKGKRQEGFVWNATDLKNFPIRMEFAHEKASVTMNYRNIKMSPPDLSQFEAPTGYTRYSDPQELVQGAMQKVLKIGKP